MGELKFNIGDLVCKNEVFGYVTEIDGFWLTIKWFDGTSCQELDLYVDKVK